MSVVTAQEVREELDELVLLRNDLDDPEFKNTPAGEALNVSMGSYLAGCMDANKWAIGERHDSPVTGKATSGVPANSALAYESMIAEDRFHVAQSKGNASEAHYYRGIIQGLEWHLGGSDVVRPSRAF